jgi:hypothetical protein
MQRLNAMADGVARLAGGRGDVFGQRGAAGHGIDQRDIELQAIARQDRAMIAPGGDERAVERQSLIERGRSVTVALAPVAHGADRAPGDFGRSLPPDGGGNRGDGPRKRERRAQLGHAATFARCALAG